MISLVTMTIARLITVLEALLRETRVRDIIASEALLMTSTITK